MHTSTHFLTMTFFKHLAVGFAGLLLLQTPACSSAPGAPADPASARGASSTGDAAESTNGQAAAPGPMKAERPWEILSEQGETYLPNIFYAEASENEQVMPVAIDGHTQIDRLIYPTLGNPNLYVKSDHADSFMTVLRLEDDALAHLSPEATRAVPGTNLTYVDLKEDLYNNVAFLLVSRPARAGSTESTEPVASGTGTNVVRIRPNEIIVNPIAADMPEAFRARKTYRFVFRKDAMADVPAGLYDVRFEVRKDGKLLKRPGETSGVYEYQFNALRVFDKAYDEYQVVNVTDTQVSVGMLYDSKTSARLDEFVYMMNTSMDPFVRNAAFITFNGDLHNGGSPGGLRERFVANDYNAEAKQILTSLKELPLPIFLIPGNHDGYVSTGQVPGAVQTLDGLVFDSLEKVLADANPKAWPNFQLGEFQSFLARTNNTSELGGLHKDIVSGSFTRFAKDTFADGWQEVPREDRNMILYDGFYQWQKTYGPLYSSHKFGKNRYVSLNSFELRQHRRSGWGMYTVNFGGGMSDVQLAWLDRELAMSKAEKTDAILLAHHDPRGGHQGKDIGYYFSQVDYRSVQQSAINYLMGKAFDPLICKLPAWALSTDQEQSCIHDGLQEWMRPDTEFDCDKDERLPSGLCDPALFDASRGAAAHQYRFSAFELISRLTKNDVARTLLLGHTHYNSYEMLQSGDELVPGTLPVDSASLTQFASLEVQNPVRAFSWQQIGGSASDYDETAVAEAQIAAKNTAFAQLFNVAAAGTMRTLSAAAQGGSRELAILRLTCNADLTTQKFAGKTMRGFSVLTIAQKKDARSFENPQINQIVYFVSSGTDKFDEAAVVDVDRTARVKLRDADNPVGSLFN